MSDEYDYDIPEEERKPYWVCDECGHEDRKRAMPPDREAFYDKVHRTESPKCPKCKSHSFMPKGF